MEKNLCPPDKIIYDEERGEYICEETGEVLEEKVIDQGADWRAFTPEERVKRSRVGSPLNLSIHDFGIITDFKINNNFDGTQRMKLIRLRKLQSNSRLKSSQDRNLAHALVEIERISSLLNLSESVKKEASLVYRRVVERGLTRGRSIEDFVVASIYIACRRMKVIRTLNEIMKYTNTKKKKIMNAYKIIINVLNITIPPSDPRDYVIKIGDVLNLENEIIKDALSIVEKARKTGLTWGKDPGTVAAGAVYLSCILHNKMTTQKEIASAVDVTEAMLRKRYTEMQKLIQLEQKNIEP